MNNDFFNKLPEEIREKLKNCKNEEEATQLLKEEMVSIEDEDLDCVAGGGDSRNIDTEQITEDFEEGRITGADFF